MSGDWVTGQADLGHAACHAVCHVCHAVCMCACVYMCAHTFTHTQCWEGTHRSRPVVVLIYVIMSRVRWLRLARFHWFRDPRLRRKRGATEKGLSPCWMWSWCALIRHGALQPWIWGCGVCGKAELWSSPFLRCSSSMFWHKSGEIPVNSGENALILWDNSGEILEECVKQQETHKQKHNSAFPQWRARILRVPWCGHARWSPLVTQANNDIHNDLLLLLLLLIIILLLLLLIMIIVAVIVIVPLVIAAIVTTSKTSSGWAKVQAPSSALEYGGPISYNITCNTHYIRQCNIMTY